MTKKYDDSLFEDKPFEEIKFDDQLFEDTKYGEEPISSLESLGRGALQGVTFGFADEIGAGIRTGLESIGDFISKDPVDKELEAQGFDIQNEGITDKYRRLLKSTRERNIETKEANPLTYLGGEIVGGIAPAIGTGGATALGKLGTIGTKEMLKEGAKAGAKYGAISSLGLSEADLTEGEVGEVVQDVALGAASGGVLGGVIPVLGKKGGEIVKKTYNNLIDVISDKKTKLGSIIADSAKKAAEGKPIWSEKALDESRKTVDYIADTIQDVISDKSKKSAMTELTGSFSGVEKINFTKKVEEMVNKLDDLAALHPEGSTDFNKIQNVRRMITKFQDDSIRASGIDPKLPTKSQAMKDLLAKKEELDIMNKIGMQGEKALDNLFNKVAKVADENFTPDSIGLEEISQLFNIPNKNKAIELAKDLVKINYTKKIQTKDGIKAVEKELKDVIKEYQPFIQEVDDRLLLRTAPGKAKIQQFRPDELPEVELTPSQLTDLKSQISSVTYGAEDRGLQSFGKQYASSKGEITDAIKGALAQNDPSKVAAFESSMKKYSALHDLDSFFKNITERGDNADVAKTKDAVVKFLNSIDKYNVSDSKIIQNTVFKKLEAANPKFGKGFREAVEDTINTKDLRELAYESSNIKLGGTLTSWGAKGGDVAGSTYKRMKQLSELPANKLNEMSQLIAKKSPKTANFLNNLSKISNPQRKNALLFSASQKPDLKSDLESLLGLEEEKK